MYDRFVLYVAIVVLVLTVSFAVAFFLSSVLQKRISQPILELAGVAKSVSDRKDYSARAKKYGDDELGFLTETFNQMMAQIHERDLALRESGERMRSVLNHVIDGIITIDERGVIQAFNPAAVRIFGYADDEVIGKNVKALMPEPYYSGHDNYLGHYLQTGEKQIIGVGREVFGRRKDGSNFPLDLAVSEFQLDGRRFFTGIVRDITQRKQAEEALRQQASLLDQTYDAILVWEMDGVITFWNRGAEEMYGYSQGDALGKSAQTLLQTRQLSPPPFFKAALRESGLWEGELEHGTRDGRKIIVESRHRLVLQDGRMFVLESNRDITERKRAEKEVRELNAELEQRVRQRTAELEATNQELEAFSYSVSHDLRAPLRHIDGYAKILLEELGPKIDPLLQRYLNRIRNSSQTLGQLVDDLLNFSRVGRLEINCRPVPLDTLVEEVVANVKAESLGRQIEWRIGRLPTLECDATLMRQVFVNLISNAVKYTRPRQKAVIEIGAMDHNLHPAIFVRDNGVGFCMKYAGKLFGVFQRLHRPEEFEGTGVGLATVQRIIQKHDGRVWAEAEVDRGATFYFTLGKPPC